MSFPTDYRHPELAGKEGRFKVLISEIKAKKLPEIDDDFAKSLGEGYETLTALKNSIQDRLRQQAEADARNRLADKAVEELLACSKLEFPSILVDVEVERMIQERKDRLAQSQISLERYLAEMGKSEDEVKAELRPRALEQVRQWLALNKLAEAEKIEVSPDEIDAEAEAIVARSQANAEVLQQALAREGSRDTLRRILLTRKTLGRLVSIVTEGTVAYPGGEPSLPDATSPVDTESAGESNPVETAVETQPVAQTPENE
jgi:trigger factor